MSHVLPADDNISLYRSRPRPDLKCNSCLWHFK